MSPARETRDGQPAPAGTDIDLETLERVQQRVLWLAVRMVDVANRKDAGGIKVGGHQASSASMVSLMTALWFAHLHAEDRVAVKPHASPVLHAIHYLIGELDRSYLTRLRALGGLQAYPSRTKDPDRVDFSTGSVGLGAVAPLFAAAVRRYVDDHFGARPASRFVALIGDAELDEGNVWEAVADPALAGLSQVLWVVDLNRQSLDRVVPGIRAGRLERLFEDAGWHVQEAKYGRRLQAAFAREDGPALRRHIDEMPNERYQSLFGLDGAECRERFLQGADAAVRHFLRDIPDQRLPELIQNLGGHDLAELLRCYRAADQVTDRPSVVFAYTVKGWGLPIAGDPLNHSAMLTSEQIDELRSSVGLTQDDEWDRLPPDSPEGRACAAVGERLRRRAIPSAPLVEVPATVDLRIPDRTSTQDTFGRLLVALARTDGVADRLVTTSPDVAVSTNLGGWINRAGVYDTGEVVEQPLGNRLLRWERSPKGQHIELGISEMNLFGMLGGLGLADAHSGVPLLPIGTLYDPFVCRGLDALIYAVYSGARFVFAGTPSGITLSPEGGAHQSTITPSIGIELPGVVLAEPAYAAALEWLLCDGLGRLSVPGDDTGVLYLRLSTRPVDQQPFDASRERLGEERLRRDVLAGAYLLSPGAVDGPVVNVFASGAVMPEALSAQSELAREGIRANVVDVTSPTRLYRDWQQSLRTSIRHAEMPRIGHLAATLPPEARHAPVVTVHDAASHALAWIGSALGAPAVPLGVDVFGQSGTIDEVYAVNELSAGHIVNAAILALQTPGP